MAKTTVINVNKVGPETKYVYCGRGSPFGNDWSHLAWAMSKYKVGTRTEAIACHRAWLKAQPELIARIRKELKGKVLGCYCKPAACHCDTLAFVADGGEL
jgi:hypothetical protein